MQYDFNKPIDRWDNNAVKYDEMEQKYGRRDLIPMWIADHGRHGRPEQAGDVWLYQPSRFLF